MPRPIDIDIKLTQHPIEGPSVTFVFTRKIKIFGLDADKAAKLALHLLDLVGQIRKAQSG